MEQSGGLVATKAADSGLAVALLLVAVAGLAAALVFCFVGWRKSEAARIQRTEEIEKNISAMAQTMVAMDQYIRAQRQPDEVLRTMLDLVERQRDRARGP